LARLVNLIYSEERRGAGTDNDPIRLVPQLFTLDGRLVCECDVWHTFNGNVSSLGKNEQTVVKDVLTNLESS
jgi:hypothetical protein